MVTRIRHSLGALRQRGESNVQVLVATGDTASIATAAGAWLGVLPVAAATLSIIWAVLRIILTCFRIAENATFQRMVKNIKARFRSK